MAISKQKKVSILNQYKDWIGKSKAVFLVEYTGATMKDLDTIRLKVREVGGEFHVVKNTLVKIALESAGMPVSPASLENSTAVGLAFEDAPPIAKVINDAGKSFDAIKVKCGYLGQREMTPAEVKALAELPPLPVVQAQLLGVLMAPASKLVRTLAEPGRQVASVIKAFSEQAAPVAA